MKITINNRVIELEQSCDVASALAIYGLQEKIFALAINGRVISRSDYASTILKEADQIDILIPMQGG
ncbi:MAG: thiamine biosynthesis protein ThiS [Gammaproteobacteria bacterium 39-13]|nr:sulfur carrier protein ThiS [Gammaproteobacteria bacterium]OJV90510.1 MAG: thiamine biosynthesis protein ThiS [Gammaproteobacteria bacterium 39-13]